MNEEHEKDELRFDKLYKLLGEEVNSIYTPTEDNQVFIDNATVFKENTKNECVEELNDVINNYSNSIDNNQDNINKDVFNIFNKKEVSNDTFKETGSEANNQLNDIKIGTTNNNNVDIIAEPSRVNISNIVPPKEEKTTEANNEIVKSDIYHNKTLIPGKDAFDDGIDNDFLLSKKNIRELLTNRKFVSVVSVLAFLCVCIVVAKAFYFGKKVDHYEEFFTEITYKEDEAVKTYDDKEIDSAVLKKMAASKLVECISSPIDMNNLPSSITDIINEINYYYNSSYNYFAFAYKDIFTGFTVSYNANQNIFTASTIKGPTDIYIYEMASQGKIDLEEILTYTSNYYNTGSGLLKSKPFNTKYSVRELLKYSTVYSDNAAHNMLMDKYGRENMRKFWNNLGTNAIFTANTNWGVTNAHDAMIYMTELYNFYANDDKYGEEVMTNFINSSPIFLKGDGKNAVANKFGWSGTAIHDVAIIFDENPYIAVALSNLGTSDYSGYFYNANRFAMRLHEEYWKYKMQTCGNIKQY